MAVTRENRGVLVSAGVPLGRRVPHGSVRWYVAQAPQGQEQATCSWLTSVVSKELLSDAFVPCKERWFKRGGQWVLEQVPMYPGYIFLVTSNATQLARMLGKLSTHITVAGEIGRGYTPVAVEAQDWYERAMDAQHVIRASTGEISNGALHVQRGPLVGQERRVCKVDRHHRRCTVAVCEGQRRFHEQVALEVPAKQ